MKKTIWIVLALCFCVAMLTVSAFADNYGGEDDFGQLGGDPTEETTTAPEVETSTEEVTDEPGESSTEGTSSEPESEQSSQGGTDATTEPNTEATTGKKPESESESVSESVSESENESATNLPTQSGSANETEQPSESETQSTEPDGGIPMPLILGGLGVACLALVVVLLFKYFRGQKA